MNELLLRTVLDVLERAPVWIRHDLAAKDTIVRNRAEETLAAMIEAAIRDSGAPTG